jgi:hypothetical protein
MKPAMARRGGRIARGLGRHPAGAGIAVAALALTCAGCSQILPLGPAPPAPRHLASAVILQLVLSQPPADGCPDGYTTLAAPFTDYPEVPDACYRKIGKPVTFTSAAVTMAYQPATHHQPALYGLNLTLSAAEAAALTAITTKAFDSRDQMAVSTAGKTWGVFTTGGPFTSGQFGILVESENQALQLQRILIPPG